MDRRFSSLWQRLGSKTDASDVYTFIVESYSQSHRYYHNLQHIQSCLNDFDEICGLTEDPDCVELALWFHDIVYDVHQKNNEQKSADLCVEYCKKAEISELITKKVRQLILATRHKDIPGRIDEQIITDVDLAILGKPANIYNIYEENIRKEYSYVPDDAYRIGRSAVLNYFLDLPTIFSTNYFYSRYNKQAVENLTRAIRNLR